MKSEFGKRLFEARKRAKKTQMQLCKAIGMAQGTYTRLESVGQGSSYTPKIAAFLGVNTEWLAYGEGEMLSTGAPPTAANTQAESAPAAAGPSYDAQSLGYYLDKITDPDQRAKTARAALQLILRQVDGPPPEPPIPEPEPVSKTRPATHPSR